MICPPRRQAFTSFRPAVRQAGVRQIGRTPILRILQIIQVILHSAGMFKLLPVIYELHLTHPPLFISLSVYHPL
ncbi:MAG: hypothetical protein EGR48_04225 [Lachnospiraceae bacterium]|nr:hypothetical protein [Lachnospiraceae bacterium]